MSDITRTSPVLVTGGSGFIALELISQLLSQGYTVHTTVRSLQNQSKVQPLRHLRDCNPEGKLLLFEADLLQEGSFRAAMQGCTVVYHVASPFKMAEKIKNGQEEMLKPALEGTKNVLSTVEETPSVTKVVLTSSVGAIAGDWQDVWDHDKDGVIREKYFNETSTAKHNPYHCSKVLAEKEAWKTYEAQGEQKRWELVSLCVALVLGPTPAASSESGSLYLMDELLSGWMFYGVPDLLFAVVDIRDVAAAHIRAAEVATARGRYIISHATTQTFLQISKHFKNLRQGSLWLPAHVLPTALVRIVGPLFGLSQKWMSRNLGVRYTVDNTRSVNELGLQYRSVEETLNAHYESWERNKKGGSSS